jgi:hypothetical protein
LINRAGKEVEFQVSPKAHVARMAAADRLLKRLTELRERLANA